LRHHATAAQPHGRTAVRWSGSAPHDRPADPIGVDRRAGKRPTPHRRARPRS
jgi:hypothetical protein